jgi:hypothetical protein
MKAIYRLEGDRLTVCAATPGKDYPKAFTAAKDLGTTIIVLAREKPANAGAKKKPEG